LNLYAGIGGNRKLWDEVMDINVTAVEWDEKIASIYQDFFPQDKMIVEDAHQYLIDHFNDGWDFIWASPPCPTHSKYNFTRLGSVGGYGLEGLEYPDMDLYQEIILLDNFFYGVYCVENVQSYYKPLIRPKKLQRHYFWSNYPITNIDVSGENLREASPRELEEYHGFNLSDYSNIDKRKILRNCVFPELGKHILECAFKKKQLSLEDIND